MTRTSRTASTLALTLLLLSLLFVAVTGAAQAARWHRYAQTRLDETTVIDVVKDVYSQKCYAVYRGENRYQQLPISLAPLGPVPCEPVVAR